MKSTNAAPFLIARAMFRRAALRVPAGSLLSKKAMRRKRPLPVEKWMKSLTLLALMAFGIAASAVALYLPLHAQSNQANFTPLQTAPGQYITPTAIPGAVQQLLNPGLPQYPNFVAGEAVRSQLSSDNKTLAVLCAGQNSLVKPDGTTDVENSTQFIFLYDVSGAHKQAPVLTQVIKQTNSHVGLVFSPDGKNLYSAGGRDDAVYKYSNDGGGPWVR